ncbi:reprolysin-like metallopeptidase [Mariniflexile sp.]|uniref:zinc-dependent metalloprotease n=1 Tax=Mariniflexile sp. TaxID=1979402 RepID=UPI003565F0E9
MKAKLHYVFSIAMFLIVFSVTSQNSYWRKNESVKDTKALSKLNLEKNKTHSFELDMASFKSTLRSTISRNSKSKEKSTLISIPSDESSFETFKIYEASVFSPELAEKYPNIKSYVGISTDNPGARLRMSVSPQGVQTMITYTDKPDVFMQPTSKGANEYVLYKRTSKTNKSNSFYCKTFEDTSDAFNKNSTISKTSLNEGGANNQELKKFRIAISVTGEYTAYHNDNNDLNGDAVADALAAINATLSRVNEVFETDMAVTFELIDATELIYTNAATDPYSNANIGANEDNFNNTNGWSLQLQNNLTNVIGNDAYDIGHLFGATGGGGIAGCIGCVCTNDTASTTDHNKGSAFTSPSNGIPEGDTFDIDFVIHEIGHQMGANHTFAFNTEGSGVNSEPGGGSTIMAYAGIEGLNNVTLNSDAYFHYHSIRQILNTLANKSCYTTETITNNSPVANAGPNYYIPAGTAYVLKGSATDADSADNLTYCWEQIDSGLVNYLNFGPDLTAGSTNRSLPPSSDSNRYIPKLTSVLAGKTTQTNPTIDSDWETVSTVARNLNWALTVRDRNPSNPSGAQSSFDTMMITVEAVTPFTVSNPVSWAQGSNVTINWVVGQTTNSTINCQNVNIKLSTDGGATFPTIIASNTPNDGIHTITVPSIPDTTTARILIEAANNIFYDVSDFDFSISTEQDFFIVEETLDPIACNGTSVTFHFEYVTANGFSENTVFSASGNPGNSTVTFSPTNLSTSGSVTMTISDLTDIPLGDYPITITGNSTSKTKNKEVNLSFNNSVCESVGNTEFSTSTTGVTFNTINNLNTGKPSGYSNYKAISTNVNREGTYDLTVRVDTDGDFTTTTKVWIDWNQNCSFDDSGEEYDLGNIRNVSNGTTGDSPLSITVPATAVLGSTIMRISTKFRDDGLPTACDNGFDGEVEDYSINVSPTLAIEEFGFENFKIFPNPNQGTFSVQLNGSLERSINMDVFDIRGRHIYNKSYQNAGDFYEEIKLNNVQSGIYILIATDGIRKSSKKIIIE